ncbi:MAG: hypothetical protein HQL48_11400 [Gammaproteobacteria bacterium]|nr:hypothetical protein [Gammaproteobacteria bacterium]
MKLFFLLTLLLNLILGGVNFVLEVDPRQEVDEVDSTALQEEAMVLFTELERLPPLRQKLATASPPSGGGVAERGSIFIYHGGLTPSAAGRRSGEVSFCYTLLGRWSERRYSYLRQQLQDQGYTVVDEGVAMRRVSRYWLYITPTSPEDGEEILRALGRFGFEDYYIIRSQGLYGTISLGLFSLQENAQQVVTDLGRIPGVGQRVEQEHSLREVDHRRLVVKDPQQREIPFSGFRLSAGVIWEKGGCSDHPAGENVLH